MSNSESQGNPMNMDSQNLSEEQQHQLLFMMLIQQHQQIGMMGLGKIKNPATDKIEKDLSSAKYAIDTLRMLQKFTEGNLPNELKDYMRQTLSTLQLNYVDEMNQKTTDSDQKTDTSEKKADEENKN
ncbi:MAG TPA: DUF1844 domain-containing protein [Balneolales bacterium]|nr:DUF1844 domain-containing protein [Balneolales bacterium]